MNRTSMDPELDSAVTESQITGALNGTTPARAPITARTLQELADDPALSTPPQWIVQPFFERGTLNSVFGVAKGGKSTLMQHMAVHVATGAAWAGYDVTDGPVLWIDLEQGPRRLLRNFRAVTGWECAGILTVSDLSNPPQLSDLRTLNASYAPALIVIDSLAKFCQVEDENDNGAWQAALQPLETFARTSRAAVVVIDHARKMEGEHGSAMRGASSKLAAFDTAIHVQRGGGPTVRTLSIVSREIGDLKVTVDRTETGYRAAGGVGAATCAVLTALRVQQDSVSVKLLTEYMKRQGFTVSGKTVSNRLQAAVLNGSALTSGTGSKNDPKLYTAAETAPNEGKNDGNP